MIGHERADRLVVGDAIRRGDHWWTIARVTHDTPKISAPVARFRCLDHNDEVREFSLPADLAVIIRRADDFGPRNPPPNGRSTSDG